MNTNLDKLSAGDLRRLADVQEQIEALEQEKAQLLSGRKKPGRKPGAKPGPKPGAKKKAAKKKVKRKMSAAGRRAIQLAQKKRWANAKKKTAKKK